VYLYSAKIKVTKRR